MKRKAEITVIPKEDNPKNLVISLKGYWGLESVSAVDSYIRDLENLCASNVVLSLENVSYLDTAGAWLIVRLMDKLKERNITINLESVRENWELLLHDVHKAIPATIDDIVLHNNLPSYTIFLKRIGKGIIKVKRDFIFSLYILGLAVSGLWTKNSYRRELTLPSIIVQIQKIGFNAASIIAVMSLIVGAIIAQQGAYQLRRFGAEIYVVDMVAILVLREMGLLLTAILVAGRSGSAITAEIGAMKMREEIDALNVMGLNPIKILIFPRILALIIVIPFLAIISDFFALTGAAIVCKYYAHIPYEGFIAHLNGWLRIKSFFLGLFKAPFIALIIGFIASIEGLKVAGSTESLGQRVTASVVKSIFLVIILDGVFAIVYATLGF